MNRIDRLQAILIHLQSKKVVTATELADRFNLSIRTVYRDIRALEEAGVPIGAEAGVGYFLSDSYHLPPVSFTNSEAAALLIGAKFVEQMSDSHTRGAYQSALFKIKSVLNSKEKDELEALQNNILVLGRQQPGDCRERALLVDVQQSIVTRTVLDIEYHAHYNNQTTHRSIEPIGMVYYSDSWHLIGYCQLRNDYRDLRIDRILHLERTCKPFTKKQHLSLEEYFEQMQQEYEMHRITLLADESSLCYIQESKYWYGFTYDEPAESGWRRLHFRNGDLQGFSRWVLMSGGFAKVEEPAELNQMVVNLVKQLNATYLNVSSI